LTETATLLFKGIFPAQPYLAAPVDIDDLDANGIPFIEHIGDLLHPLIVKLGNVYQSVRAGKYLHKSPEVEDLFTVPS
jgi:hypothetical protein